jgi:deoxyadenosine/deoxycytidine kinase
VQFGAYGYRGSIIPRADVTFLAVSGIMGSGKTTLAQRLGNVMGLTYVAESSLGGTFLQDLRQDRRRWAFDAQLAFLCQKATTTIRAIENGARIILDRSLYEDIGIFSKLFRDAGHIDERSYAIYENLVNYFLEELPPPDAIIHCACTAETSLRRVSQRNREDQLFHTPEHISEISRRYEEWLDGFDRATVLLVDSEQVDFRQPAAVQTIAGEIERFFSVSPAVPEQMSLFSTDTAVESRSATTDADAGLVKVLRRVPRSSTRFANFGSLRPHPYPTAYLAAPFTGIATPPREEEPSNLFRVGQPEGQILRGRYRTSLLGLAKALEDMGVHVILPHRDVNRWGQVSLTPEQVVSACTAHLAGCDFFVGLLGMSHGSHFEFGIARGQGKPAIVIHCSEIVESFVASGVKNVPGILVVRCKSMAEMAVRIQAEDVRDFLGGGLPGWG